MLRPLVSPMTGSKGLKGVKEMFKSCSEEYRTGVLVLWIAVLTSLAGEDFYFNPPNLMQWE